MNLDIQDVYPQFNKSPEDILTRAKELFKESIAEKYDFLVERKPYYTLTCNDRIKMLNELEGWEELKPSIKMLFIKKAENEIIKLKMNEFSKNYYFDIKEACPHEDFQTTIHRSSSGYDYDLSWVEYACHLCGYRHTEYD